MEKTQISCEPVSYLLTVPLLHYGHFDTTPVLKDFDIVPLHYLELHVMAAD